MRYLLLVADREEGQWSIYMQTDDLENLFAEMEDLDATSDHSARTVVDTQDAFSVLPQQEK